MFRARVCDPLGPRWLLTLGPSLAAALIALAPVVPLLPVGPSLRATAVLLGVTMLLGRRLLRVRPRAREAGVRVGSGEIEIRDAGILNQRVRSSDVIAASTARTQNGAAIAIVRRGCWERPLLLDFASDAELDAVRRALAIGHLGFGEVAWPTQPRGAQLHASGALAVAWFAIAACAALDAPLLGFALALAVLPATVVAVLVSCLSDPRGPYVALTPAGVVVTDFSSAGAIRYGDVVGARVDREGVSVATTAGPVAIPMPRSLPEEHEHLAAQILSAAARARGEGPTPSPLPASLARLAPRGETERAWLQRVDVAAASMGHADVYRSVALNPKELWSALENPDAPVRVRAAAARVLTHVSPDEARTRVRQVLAVDRNACARSYIRVAVEDDVELAAQDLEELSRRYEP